MKKYFYAAVALVMMAGAAHSQSVNGKNQADSDARAQSVVNQYSKGSKNAASAIAPSTSAGMNSCMYSAGIGAAWSGIGGSLGIPFGDARCNERLDAVAIVQVTNDRDAAKERLCDNPKTRRAFAAAGRPCSADRARYQQVSAATATRSTRRAQVAAVTSAGNAKMSACLRRQQSNPSVKCDVYR